MEETFSLRVKEELARSEAARPCCERAELLGLIRAGGVLEAGQKGLTLRITTESPAVARRLFLLLKKISGLKAEIAGRPRRIHHHTLYSVTMPAQPGLKEFLSRLGFLQLERRPAPAVVAAEDCCRRAYLKGFFLGAGSISNPERAYHLELVTGSRVHAGRLIRLLRTLGLKARRVERKGYHVVYLKESEEIAALLTLLGAVQSRLELENVRVVKGMRNQVNRLVNCETANLSKTVEAACRQVENIRFLVQRVGLENLPERLREVARLRLEYPEATLRELGTQLRPPLGKSGVNHRLRRLEEMAADLRRTSGSGEKSGAYTG